MSLQVTVFIDNKLLYNDKTDQTVKLMNQAKGGLVRKFTFDKVYDDKQNIKQMFADKLSSAIKQIGFQLQKSLNQCILGFGKNHQLFYKNGIFFATYSKILYDIQSYYQGKLDQELLKKSQFQFSLVLTIIQDQKTTSLLSQNEWSNLTIKQFKQKIEQMKQKINNLLQEKNINTKAIFASIEISQKYVLKKTKKQKNLCSKLNFMSFRDELDQKTRLKIKQRIIKTQFENVQDGQIAFNKINIEEIDDLQTLLQKQYKIHLVFFIPTELSYTKILSILRYAQSFSRTLKQQTQYGVEELLNKKELVEKKIKYDARSLYGKPLQNLQVKKQEALNKLKEALQKYQDLRMSNPQIVSFQDTADHPCVLDQFSLSTYDFGMKSKTYGKIEIEGTDAFIEENEDTYVLKLNGEHSKILLNGKQIKQDKLLQHEDQIVFPSLGIFLMMIIPKNQVYKYKKNHQNLIVREFVKDQDKIIIKKEQEYKYLQKTSNKNEQELNKQLQSKSQQFKKFEKQSSTLKKQLQAKVHLNQELSTKMSSLEKSLSASRNQTKSQIDKIQAKDSQLKQKIQQLEDTKSQLKKNNLKLSQLKKQLQNQQKKFKEQAEQYKKRNQQLQSKNKQKEVQIQAKSKQLKIQRDNSQKSIIKIQNESNIEITKTKNQLKTLKGYLDEAKEQLKKKKQAQLVEIKKKEKGPLSFFRLFNPYYWFRK